MNINESTITKRTLTELDRLDPVTFIAEDFGPGQGKLTIDCYGKAWTAYWGGIGSKNVLEFISTADTPYIAGKMFSGHPRVTDYDEISKAIDEEVDRDTLIIYSEKLVDRYGQDWYMDLPTCSDSDYLYLCRIIDAVKTAVDTLVAAAA